MTRLTLAPAALAAYSVPAWAQCSMCRTAAAAQDAAAASAFNAAILILLLPAVGVFCGVYLFAYRRRDAEAADAREQS